MVVASTGGLKPDDKSALDEVERDEEFNSDEVGKESCG